MDKDVIAYFNQHYIKTEKFPKLLGRKIHTASDIREDSDYEDFYLATKKDAEEQIETANELIKYIENYVKEN